MLVKTFGSTVYGLEAATITVEVNVTAGLHTFVIGLPDNAVKESIRRVESALKASGYFMPRTKLVINLAPADIRKSGSTFDLPIALGILGATGQLPLAERLTDYMMTGELSLDGSLQPLRGALAIAIRAHADKFKALFIPKQNAGEAGLAGKLMTGNFIAGNLKIFGSNHLREVVAFFTTGEWRNTVARENASSTILDSRSAIMDSRRDPLSGLKRAASPEPESDFSDVKGQDGLKRALEVAAAGGHHVLLIGPPGAGKTMIAKRMPGILPPLSLQEALETTRIHSVAGKLGERTAILEKRPFRSPHHTLSQSALVGGGTHPQPGEISLAHNGVLFLDELPEFSRSVLEVMRQPMEDGKVTISRTKWVVDFPASFMLLAAMNPCPCGYYGHPDRECTCPPGAVRKYLQRISGPLLDRIDLHIEVTPVAFRDFVDKRPSETSAVIRERVIRARRVQEDRYKDNYTIRATEYTRGIRCNAQMNNKGMEKFCRIDRSGQELLRAAMDRLKLSARAYDRILKVSRTIADLDQSACIKTEHLAEAIQYRSLDRETWGA